MDFQTTDPVGPDDDTWVDAIGNFLAGAADSIIDFAVGDLPSADPDTGQQDSIAGGLTGTESTGSDLPNDGFYQSMPSMDAVTGQLLDQTYELIDEINDFGQETFGEQDWHDTLAWAQTDPYGLTEGIETPSEMQLRFAQQDAASERSFRDWQDQQAAQQAVDAADNLIVDSENLAWDTDWLLKNA